MVCVFPTYFGQRETVKQVMCAQVTKIKAQAHGSGIRIGERSIRDTLHPLLLIRMYRESKTMTARPRCDIMYPLENVETSLDIPYTVINT